MIFALLGRFFRFCLDRARKHELRMRIDDVSFQLMTDAEISDAVHGRPLDFAKINARGSVTRLAGGRS